MKAAISRPARKNERISIKDSQLIRQVVAFIGLSEEVAKEGSCAFL